MKDLFELYKIKDVDFIFDGYSIISNSNFSIAVPKDCPERLQKRLGAAIQSYFGGFKSIDYVLKMYGHLWDVSDYESKVDKKLILLDKKVHFILNSAKDIYMSVYNKRSNLKNLPDKIGLVAAGLSLMRLISSFKASSFLIEKGYNFEAMCINKLILEQIAWAYKVHRIENDNVFKIKPPSSITSLRNSLYPNAGKVYGFFNKHAHMEPTVLHQVLNFDGEEMKVILLRKDISLITGYYLMILADIYGICMEYVYKDFFSEFDFLKHNSKGGYTPKKSRKSAKLLKKAMQDVVNLFNVIEMDKIFQKV